MRKRVLLVSCIMVLLCCFGVTVSVSAATNTTKTTITTLTEKAEGKIYLSWSKKNVDGYQVRWALNSKMTGVKTASFTTTEMYRSGLIGGKTYYFQVRTYKIVNGKKSLLQLECDEIGEFEEAASDNRDFSNNISLRL